MSIPEFDKNGELPPGEHFATIEQIDERFGKSNPRRIALMAGLKSAIENFVSAGFSIFATLSFTNESKIWS